MSDRLCNYCTFRVLKADAKKKDMAVTKKTGTGQLGGVDVYVHPSYVVPTDAFWKRWYMALPDHCCC